MFCGSYHKPLIALSLIPDSKRPTDTFALIFSLSHVIADGHTYYQILDMLSPVTTGSKQPLQQLNPTRKHTIVDDSKRAMGKTGLEAKLVYGTPIIFNVVGTMLCSCKKLMI